jgi:hypothetical protein
MPENAELEQLKDELAKSAFGVTKKEVQDKGICINCKQPALPKCHSEAGKREYRISGMCEECFDKLFGE